MTFSDRETLVIHTMVMRFSEDNALKYLASHGHKIAKSTLYSIKSKIRNSTLKQKFELQKRGLFDQHMDRIHQLETTSKLAWENYFLEKDPYKKTKILQIITDMQPLLSQYYEATQYVIEEDVRRATISANRNSNFSE